MDILATAAAEAEPVSQTLRDDFLAPFIEAATLTLGEMAGTEIVVAGVYHKKDPTLLGSICGLLRMAGTDRTLVLSFPAETAKAVAGRILTTADIVADDDLVRDCLGEVTNVVAGQAKALLAESPYRFSLSTPLVVNDAGHGRTLGDDCLIVLFQCDLGPFALQLFPGH